MHSCNSSVLSLRLYASSLYRFVNHEIAKTLSTLPIVSCITVKTKALRRKGVDRHNHCLNDQNTLSYCRRLLTAKINFSSYGLKDFKRLVIVFLQSLPTVKQTSHFLPRVMMKIQDSGFLRILTNGSVILATPERMFSLVTQVSERV